MNRHRIQSAGACLREAFAELAALPVESRERAIAGQVLLRCCIEIAKEPGNRTSEDEKFMTSTQDIFKEWQSEAEAVGRAQGIEKGLAKGRAESIVVIYEIRFGAMPPELKSAIEGTEEAMTLLAWLRLVETSSAETFAATVLASRAG